MNDQQADTLITAIALQNQIQASALAALERIAESLAILSRAGEPKAPDYQKPIAAYPSFDWESIGASVIGHDDDGPTHVEYNGKTWTRRSPSNRFDPAIWFSRGNGRDAEGNMQYLRLITFKPVKSSTVDPLPEKTRQASTAGGTPQAPTSKPAPIGRVNGVIKNGNGVTIKATVNRDVGNLLVAAGQATESASPAPAPKPVNTNGKVPAGKPLVDAEKAKATVAAIPPMINKDQVDAKTYYGDIGKLPISVARQVAASTGIDVNGRNQNFAKAYPLLPYFREGYAYGLEFDDLIAILTEKKMDIAAALDAMRKSHKPK